MIFIISSSILRGHAVYSPLMTSYDMVIYWINKLGSNHE